jgi:DNA mismatch repair endonuclease MutH
MKLPYNPSDKKSIIDYAKRLVGKSLRQSCAESVLLHNYTGKGHFGQILEQFYFGYKPNSKAEADFNEVGMELKSSPLKKDKNNHYKAKERIVLSIINYNDIVEQTFESSTFLKKNASILMIFYLHENGVDVIDLTVKLVDEWSFTKTDLDIIKKDWEIIHEKVLDGRAHELSEGDTFYLGACTKGANAKSLRMQPFCPIPAMQRAFALKQGYVNHIIATISKGEKEKFGKLIKSDVEIRVESIEEMVLSKFKIYYGKSIDEIHASLQINLNPSSKNYFSNITNLILGIELDKKIEEFEKADITVKTIRLKENNLPKEDISFPSFKYEELVNEDWEESEFKDVLEKKFLFVFYQFSEEKLILRKAKFWNMPYEDILEAKKVWEKTKSIVKLGNIVKEVKGGKRTTNFPGKSFNKVSHVRPHAKNANDTYPLPTRDKITNTYEYTKHCFWLNNIYIRDYIYLI